MFTFAVYARPQARELSTSPPIRSHPELLERLEFDSESGAVGIYASNEADFRAVAQALGELAASHSS